LQYLKCVRERGCFLKHFLTEGESEMIQPTKIVAYGSFLAIILSKKSTPGDGVFGRGVKGV
jgi:hypothetical protein